MKKRVMASTKIGYELPIEEAVLFSGTEAGFCYMPENVDTLLAEESEKTLKRANGTMKSGHHSVFGHPSYCFAIEEVPKIIAMMLNNEKVYQTSEKSARYTKMQSTGREKELYEKWIDIFAKEIDKIYPVDPNVTAEKRAFAINKKAQENARYLISVFTPATSMGHTLDFRQLNYEIHWAEDFIKNEPDTKFNKKLKVELQDFVNTFSSYKVDGINTDAKQRKFSLFASRKRDEEFGENYSINYLGTFAELAQAQRHRTIYYEMTLLDEPQYFVPPIIENTNLEEEWLKDISSLEENFPQGMLVLINERGTIENFILKCKERLCGEAQLEIAIQTKKILDRYLEETKDKKPEIYEYLKPYSYGARCTFPGYTCGKPCIFGPKGALERKF